MKKRKIRSLRTKIIVSLVGTMLVLSVALMVISYFAYKKAITKQYEARGKEISCMAISLLDDQIVKKYVNQMLDGDPNEIMQEADYQNVTKVLRTVREANDVLYLYMIYPTDKGVYFIFDSDEPDKALPFGHFIEYYDNFSGIIDDLLLGKAVPSIVTNEKYGWLSTTSWPYINDQGELLGYVVMDVSMNDVAADCRSFMKQLIVFTLVLVVLTILIDLFTFYIFLVKPIKQMSDATQGYLYFTDEDRENASLFDKLDIHTGDELEVLSLSLKKMEKDLKEYVKELTSVTAEKERIGVELDVATKIQANMLPRLFPAFPGREDFAIFASMNPAKEVGGDFYDFFLLDEDHLGIVMADVSGKGVPAALFMVIAKTLIKNRAMMGGTTAEILSYVNEQLCDGNDSNYFVTVWLSILDISTGKGIATNAGHENPVIKRADGEFELVKNRHSPALGVMEGIKFRIVEYQLNPGDRLFVYTDGVPEATNASEEMFGNERMLKVLNKYSTESAEGLLLGLKKEVDNFVGEAPQFDDITMLCLDYFGGQRMEEPHAKLIVDAKIDNLDQVNAFLEEELEKLECSMKMVMQTQLAAEEIFVNIASYAYVPGEGQAEIVLRVLEQEQKMLEIEFSDSGIPYDPLAKEDPDVTLSAEERKIGGLGIFMAKKNMDEVLYEYKDGRNVLTMRKAF